MLKYNTQYSITYKKITGTTITVTVNRNSVKYILNELIANEFLKTSEYSYIILDGILCETEYQVLNIETKLKDYFKYFTLNKSYTPIGLGILIKFNYIEDNIEDLINYFRINGKVLKFEEITNK